MCQVCNDPLHLAPDTGIETTSAAPDIASDTLNAPVAFTLPQIILQLQTQWGGTEEGVKHTWQQADVTYSLADAAPTNLGGVPSEASGLVLMSPVMKEAARLSFELWDDLIAINLTESAGNTNADVTFNYSSATSGGGTYARTSYYLTTPTREIAGSQIWANSTWTTHNDDADMFLGGYGLQTYLHEIGHSLGLSHAGTYNAGGGTPITYANSAEYTQDNRQFTIMSYFGGYNTTTNLWTPDGGGNRYSSTPMLHDVAAIQDKYGADYTTRAGDTVYGFNSTAGRSVFDFTINTNPIVTIWDGGGIDTLDVSGFSQNQRVDLNEGTYSDIGAYRNNVAIAYGAVIENAVGGSGNDTITGNAANNDLKGGAGVDTLNGEDGHDTLDGGAGADVLNGGGGNDTLIFDNFDTITGGAGNDWAIASATSGPVNLTLTATSGIEGVMGTAGADIINASATTAGISLIGGAGADRLIGGSGSDSIVFDNLDVVEGGGGTDWAIASGTSAALNVTLTDAASIEGIVGTELADRIDASATTLGVSIVSRGGIDTIIGGFGADTFYFDNDDIIVGGSGVDWAIANLSAPLSFVLTDSMGLEGVVGAATADRLDASAMTLGITLSGRGGLDTLIGGAGNDTFYFSNGTSIVGGGGTDWAIADAVGAVSITLTNAMSVEGAVGTEAGDVLDASAVTSSVTLYGRGGADTLRGGSASDVIFFDSFDTIFGGIGRDMAVADLSASLNVSLTDAMGIEILVGSENSDVVNASALTQDVILSGRGGADVLTGGSGADTIYFDHLDTIAGGAGYDLAVANNSNALNVTLTNAMSIEAFVATGSADTINAAAVTYAMVLVGDAGNDTIYSGAAADTIYGGLDTDTVIYAGNSASFIVTRVGTGYQVASNGVIDTLYDVEYLQFSNTTLFIG